MTDNHDELIERTVDDYLNHIEAGTSSDPPSLVHLSDAARAEVEAIIANIAGGHQFDPTESAPSLESLLAGTPFYDALTPDVDPAADLHEVQSRLDELAPWSVQVRRDPLGLGGLFVVVVNGHRLRAQIRVDAKTPADLRSQELLGSAGAVFGMHPDTAGLVVIHRDSDMSSVVVDPFDPEWSIETPSGALVGPRPRRRIMPLPDAVRGFIEEIAPQFDPIALPSAAASYDHSPLRTDVHNLVRDQVEALVSEGMRARTDAKTRSWTSLGDDVVEAVRALIDDARAGRVNEQSIERWLDDVASTLR